MSSRFPVLKDTGPIEATTIWYVGRAKLLFPVLKDTGPIEASNGVNGDPSVILFPVLKDTGPIEAETSKTKPSRKAGFQC